MNKAIFFLDRNRVEDTFISDRNLDWIWEFIYFDSLVLNQNLSNKSVNIKWSITIRELKKEVVEYSEKKGIVVEKERGI